MASLINGSTMYLLILATSIIYMAHKVNAGPVTGEDSCPPDMRPTCRRICFAHCGNLNSTTESCILPCFYGCECKDLSYVRTSENSKVCVPPSTCKVTCPKNMHFNPCLKKTEPNCDDNAEKQEFPCKPRCVCDDGYVSNGDQNNRQCIKRSECPPPRK